ncbi:MAG: TetR/AcrR family transcriptional regulator [Pirellula sp.]|jgi:AcrR family transcriptional regulator
MGVASDSEKTKASVIQAAGELFANSGFSGVTARQVAAKSGVSLGAIPYHFGSMENLYEEVLLFALSVSEEAIPFQEQANAAKPREGFRLAIQWMIKDYAAQKVAWPVKLIEREAIDPSASFRNILKHKYLPEFEWLCEVVSRVSSLPKSSDAVRFGVITMHLLTSTFMTHRRVLQEFAPTVVNNANDSDVFIDVVARLTLDAVKRYGDGFPLKMPQVKKSTSK